ncbi:MAG TPA: OmpA family protein [Polyangia bacterium]|nr:OmpA family protein [Polyangia bacterium]
MLHRRHLIVLCAAAWAGAMLAGAPEAHAQPSGFAINRYEPTAAGEWSFLVEHPWYSDVRSFAGGITFNYAHNPLVLGERQGGGFTRRVDVIGHQFLLHVDLAVAFAGRVLVSASFPVVLLERGTPTLGIGPITGGTIGDPRLGAMVRLYGYPDRNPFSVSVGFSLWAPLGVSDHAGDRTLRFLPQVVFAGLSHSVRWSATAGYYWRSAGRIGLSPRMPGNSSGPELQFGALLQYANQPLRLSIGPEATLTTIVPSAVRIYCRYCTSAELLLGIQHNIRQQVMIGVAGGVGFLLQPGTPDFRLLLRLAYAPTGQKKALPPDRDHDGVVDAEDACPDDAGVRSTEPERNGCRAGEPETFVVLPEEGGRVGAITVESHGQQETLDRAYSAVRVGPDGKVEQATMSREEVRRAFGSLADQGTDNNEVFVVLPEEGGQVGAITVDAQGQQAPLDHAYSAARVGPDGHMEQTTMTREEVRRIFGSLADQGTDKNEVFVVLPEEGGKVGAITVDAHGQQQTLDRAYSAVRVGPEGQVEQATMSREEVERLFGPVANQTGDTDEVFVVVPEAGGKVGAITVDAQGQQETLDRAYSAVRVGPGGKVQRATMTPEEVSRLFGSLPATAPTGGKPELFVVLPEEGGKVGAITVESGDTKQTLDSAYDALRLSPDGQAQHTTLSADEVQRLFGDAMAARPIPPSHFTYYFDLSQQQPTNADAELAKMRADIARRRTYNIQVIGHSDRAGAEQRNLELSLQRAQGIRKFLIKSGVPAAAITVFGRGELQPLIPTPDGVAEPRNRRVEVLVQ